VSNGNGTDTHCKTLYLGVSAQENPVLQSQILVSPNPFTDFLSVSLSAALRSPVFHLYDLAGREICASKMELGINEVKLATLAPGLYFWQVRSGGEVVKTGKVVKASNGE
jgi:hypothetical protein